MPTQAPHRRARRPKPSRSGSPLPPAGPAPRVGRICIEDVTPRVDGGRFPAKAVPGETFEVAATIFREGHGELGAQVVLYDPHGRTALRTPLRETARGTDRWTATVEADAPGRWSFTVEAWSDPLADWYHEAGVKLPADIDTELVLTEGALLLKRAAANIRAGVDRSVVERAVEVLLTGELTAVERLEKMNRPRLRAVLDRHPLRELVTVTEPLPLQVDRPRALFGSWYEFFPRSEGAKTAPGTAPVSGTFRTAMDRLPAIARMGFDVVYLPPIHPIGTAHRKGPDNAAVAGPHDVGSPWAIGSPDGGHDAIHPDLGTFADFDAFVERARELGLEIALDFALQCSPDHPWVTRHPRWFRHRADGSIAYAENPPKKYQDIYPIDFDQDFEGLVAETVRLLRFWAGRGVRIFRVDNPHTKPVSFWEAVLGRMAESDPDVLFLAEAFTRPAMMRALARVGFHQSYTYFTWRTGKHEIIDYLTELSRETDAYLRPNLFVNTPDILPLHLQSGGRPAFELRAVLAATLSPSWGMYAGYELCENTPLKEGGEEYLASEKYELRPRDWESAEAEGRSLAPLITRLNTIRRSHPALQQLRTLRFHHTDNDALLAYSKRTGDDTVITVVNLDPHRPQEGTVSLDMPRLGRAWDDRITVRDELSGDVYAWGQHNYVRLDPAAAPAHILSVRRDT
ncbi:MULTISPECIES: alpha-1,4-glucan--maltose-1-phosphate maltosyltransferase [Streptomyces]|uniref:alpha-1,4-glucan--maltose-1-phosphate maltosyltransferase n=1 Tax=Streptomyces TaxID=1883 RepID=UPI001672821C|nr:MULTISPECIES: alpha-1,4-glucan--maltose-1-phosphate maltosyltransferase [Streptomyces]MBK3527825.1 alpha-1,4-glucan--maltose-1-phosphate maltosyltransferase [Streptomyces sp. MBT70]GGR95404.1 alpha-1,4-glucan:maltose-1-phosphate maltosyltransferase 2 [Streptomyces eurythermus]